MPKMKTNASARKRFKFTGSGKIKRKRAFGSHILTSKTAKRKRKLKQTAIVHFSDMKEIRRLLANA